MNSSLTDRRPFRNGINELTLYCLQIAITQIVMSNVIACEDGF